MEEQRESAPGEIKEFSELAEGFLRAAQETLSEAASIGRHILYYMENQTVSVEKISDQIAALAESIHEGDARQEKKLADTTRAENAKLDAQISRLAGVQEIQERNLSQIRIQCEKLARRSEELSEDFIERQVLDPLFKELLVLYGQIQPLTRKTFISGSGEMRDILQTLERFFDARGLIPITAKSGEEFDPKQHRPIKTNETSDVRLKGRIISGLQPGLRRNGRVVQQARVAVYTLRKTAINDKWNKGE